MPDLAAFTINDGAATPVAHVFSPVGITNGIASFEDRATGVQLSMPVITQSLSRPSVTQKNNRYRVKIVIPVLETLGNNTVSGIVPAPTKPYDLICNMEFVMPARASATQRADLIAYAKNLLTTSGTGANAAVATLDGWF